MLYDVIIVGGGPAGITAGIYAKRAGRNVAILEKFVPGGQLNLIGEIENYTGFKKVIGSSLAYEMYDHAKTLGIPFIMDEAQEFDLEGDEKIIKGRKGEYHARSAIMAQGCHTRELGITGEEEFKGRGVSYCAVCDGNFFKGKKVAVVGSGDSAYSEDIYLSSLFEKVYLLTKANLKLHNYAENELEKHSNIQLLKGAISTKISGDESVKSLAYIKDEKEDRIEVEGIFVAIGKRPDTENLRGKIDLNEQGYIKSDEKMNTSEDGVFVCGDVKEGSIKQIATAVGEGAIAGTEAAKYVLRQMYAKK